MCGYCFLAQPQHNYHEEACVRPQHGRGLQDLLRTAGTQASFGVARGISARLLSGFEVRRSGGAGDGWSARSLCSLAIGQIRRGNYPVHVYADVMLCIHACIHLSECMHACMHAYIQINEQMDGWRDGWTDGWMDTYRPTYIHTYQHACMHTYIHTNKQTNNACRLLGARASL